MENKYNYDWSDLAFGSKKPLSSLNASFLYAPREMTLKRFKEIVKTKLPKNNLVIGFAKEKYVSGFEDQSQFKTLQFNDVSKIIELVNKSSSKNKIYTLSYFQSEVQFIINKLKFKNVILVNGSWKQSFHTRPEYYEIANQSIPFEYISPFSDETEAIKYAQSKNIIIKKTLDLTDKYFKNYTEAELLTIAEISAKQSYDHTFQTGVAIVRKEGKKYKLISTSYNTIVPYETYAMHHGASREKYFSPPNDLNHYDTVHAEVNVVIESLNSGIKLDGCCLFINLLPCPVCARILIKTGIKEIIYQHDHSDGYALKLLASTGIDVRRSI